MEKMMVVFGVFVVISAALVVSYGSEITGYVTDQPDAPDNNIDDITTFLDSFEQSHETATSDFQSLAHLNIQLCEALVSEGFNARVVIGNNETATADANNLRTLNHAWIIMMEGPRGRLAVETAGCRIMDEDENPLYYDGYTFTDTSSFMEYIMLLERYDAEYSDAKTLQSMLDSCIAESEEMATEYNIKYEGRFATEESRTELSLVYEKNGECMAISDMLGDSLRSLSYIEHSISNLILSSAVRLA